MRWSNSALFTLQQCGERFRRRYIERDFRPTGVKAKRGTAVHKIAADSHMRQLKAKEGGASKDEYLAGALPTIEEAKDTAATAFDAAMQEGCAFTEDEEFVGKDKVAGEQKDTAVLMATHYVGVIAPRVDPVGVERRVTIRPADTDIEITGIVDLISEEDDVPDGDGRRIKLGRIEVVNDLKTADRQPREDAANTSQQLALYALIRTAETGKPPDKVRLRTMVKTRTGKVSSVEQSARKEPADLEAVAQRLNTAIQTVQRGVFVPANPDSWWCSEKYCEFWTDCVYALGRGR